MFKRFRVLALVSICALCALASPRAHAWPRFVRLPLADAQVREPKLFGLSSGFLAKGSQVLAVQTQAASSDFVDLSLVKMGPPRGLDLSFGESSGHTWVDPDAEGISPFVRPKVVPLRNGKFLVLFHAKRSMVRLYSSDGIPESNFGKDGVLSFPHLSSHSNISGLGVSPSGEIYMTQNTGTELRVARFRANGTIDPAYGIAGVLTLKMDGGDRSLGQVAFAGDGSFYVVYYLGIGSGSSESGLAIRRFDREGLPDAHFGRRGRMLFLLPFLPEDFLALSADGRVMTLTGLASTGGGPEAAVIDLFEGKVLAHRTVFAENCASRGSVHVSAWRVSDGIFMESGNVLLALHPPLYPLDEGCIVKLDRNLLPVSEFAKRGALRVSLKRELVPFAFGSLGSDATVSVIGARRSAFSWQGLLDVTNADHDLVWGMLDTDQGRFVVKRHFTVYPQ